MRKNYSLKSVCSDMWRKIWKHYIRLFQWKWRYNELCNRGLFFLGISKGALNCLNSVLCTAVLSQTETWVTMKLFCDKVTHLSIQQLFNKNAKPIAQRTGYIFQKELSNKELVILPHVSYCVSLFIAVAILLLCFIVCHDCVCPMHLRAVLFPNN